ncbi:hypothetical protein LRP88_07360 [Fusarium phalaenopsidis]
MLRRYASGAASAEPNNPGSCVPSQPTLVPADGSSTGPRVESIAALDSTLLFGTADVSSFSGPGGATDVQDPDIITLTAAGVNSNSHAGREPLSKRGLAYNDVGLTNTFRTRCPRCSRAYNWASGAGELSLDLSFVPMLWSGSAEHTGAWEANMARAIARGSSAILSFNEPDRADQANMSPEEAALSHIQHLNPYRGKVMIGAPSVTNSREYGQGLDWLSAFFDACAQQEQDCAVDFCPVHWYSGANNGGAFWTADLLQHLSKAHEACGWRPVWLTEFAVPGSSEEIEAFLRDALPKLENLDYLSAYFYFMVSVGSLMSSDTSLSPYGEVYASLG